MSVGSTVPKSQGTPPAPVVRSRYDPRPTHKVSFKLTKPKPSKARYLTSSELWGIGASVILSGIISIAIVYVGVTFVPILANIVVDIVRDVMSMETPPTHNEANKLQSQRVPKFITLTRDLNCTHFASHHHHGVMLFETSNTRDAYSRAAEMLNSDYAEQRVSVQKVANMYRCANSETCADTNVLSMTTKEYQSFEWDLNEQFERGSHFVSDATALAAMPKLTSLLKTPSLPHSASAKEACTLRNPPFHDYHAQVISFGKRNQQFSGPAFHAHLRSASELLQGRKHWVIFPPGQVPANGFNPFENLADWRERVYPTLTGADAEPIEVIQEAGQVVFIPEGWYHAAQTLSETSISVRYQPREVESGSYYFYLVKGDQKAALFEYPTAAKLYRLGLAVQPSAVLFTRLGAALEQQGLLTEAEEAYKEGLNRNPRDPYIYAMLVNFYVSHAKKDTSGSVSTLLENAAAYGLKDAVLELMNDAF